MMHGTMNIKSSYGCSSPEFETVQSQEKCKLRHYCNGEEKGCNTDRESVKKTEMKVKNKN
jgi:hypothetical protein